MIVNDNKKNNMMIDRYVYISCYLYLLLSLTNSKFIDYDLSEVETRLIRMLLNESTYLKKVRPSNKVIVDIRVIFNQIISMVEKEQIIVTNCFVDQKWTGYKIKQKKINKFRNFCISRSSSYLESIRF